MKSFLTINLGCKVNAYECDAIANLLEDNGYVLDVNNPDLVIVNTCSVTATSDSKSRQKIRKLIKEHPNAIMCVMGCYSQLEPIEVSQIEGVNIVIGTKYRSQIYELIEEYKQNKKQIVKVDEYDPKQKFEYLNVTPQLEKTRAYLKIQDGCNNFCTYCIIPYARGPQRSRDKEDIFNEVESLLKKGYKEIVLTGIHTGSYGFENKEYRLSDLINDLINKFPNLYRIRISSIEVIEIDDKLIDLIANSQVVVDHLHIPLQAGSNEILKLMNRKDKKEAKKLFISFQQYLSLQVLHQCSFRALKWISTLQAVFADLATLNKDAKKILIKRVKKCQTNT